MKERLISFETAKLAKEKGFRIHVLNCYNENEELGDVELYFLTDFNQWKNIKGSNTNLYSAPTQSLFQKYLREKYGIHIEIQQFGNTWCFKILSDTIYSDDILYNSYEEALEVAEYKILTLLP